MTGGGARPTRDPGAIPETADARTSWKAVPSALAPLCPTQLATGTPEWATRNASSSARLRDTTPPRLSTWRTTRSAPPCAPLDRVWTMSSATTGSTRPVTFRTSTRAGAPAWARVVGHADDAREAGSSVGESATSRPTRA